METPKYIERRLRVEDEQGSRECREGEFLAIRGPLVVLGDPGLGKSRLVKEFCGKPGEPSTYVTAISLPMDRTPPNLLPEETFPRKTVIDEVDAIIADDPQKIVEKVLAYLGHFTEANFILVCRSADWVRVGHDVIKERWGKTPVVGTLLPLDEDEARQVAGSLTPGRGDVNFFEEARKRGLGPLLGNPQLLGMLLKTESNGWPESKRDLYENVCRYLARENDEKREQFMEGRRPDVDSLCDTAGFVFTQLLLSGTEKVSISDIEKLSSDAYPKRRVKSTIATNLFHAIDGDTFAPHHRTIAEYLAARWLVRSIEKPGLRTRDVEALLRANSDMVPSSTRGVHAWVATLSQRRDVRSRFIRRDPYGLWCYGDRGQLNDMDAIRLLDNLTEHAQRDPGFYDGSGRVNFGSWPKTDHLMNDIIDRIRDGDTPPGMVGLLVESIPAAFYSPRLKGALRTLVLDANASNRALCLDSLARHTTGTDLDMIVAELLDMADVESLCVANSAITRHSDKIDGKIIARALADSGGHTEYLGLGQHEIYRHLSEEKAGVCLCEAAKIAAGADGSHVYGAKRSIVPLLKRVFELDAPPPADRFWEYLRLVGRPWNFENDTDGEVSKYLKEHDEYRRKVQSIIIFKADRGELRNDLVWLEMRWNALSVDEADWFFHLEDLAKQRPQGWGDRWVELHAYGRECRFSDARQKEACDLAGRHEIQLPVDSSPPAVSTTITEKPPGARTDGPQEAEEDPSLAKWRAHFARYHDEVTSGKAVRLLQEAAIAYFGHGLAEGASPEERVASLAGKEQVDNVFAGIYRAVTEGTGIPKARELAKLHAQDQINGYEYILLVGCHRLVSSGGSFEKTPPADVQSALAAFHLNSWAGQHEENVQARERLEKIVFQDPEVAEKYFRDIIEPYLEQKANTVPGIDIMSRRPSLSDVAGQLSCGWVRDFPGLPDGIFWKLLSLARTGHARAEMSRGHLYLFALGDGDRPPGVRVYDFRHIAAPVWGVVAPDLEFAGRP